MKPTDIFVTSFHLSDDGVVRAHETAQEVGRPNGFDFIHGMAENKMCENGGYDIPCFYNHCPTTEGIYPVTILYKESNAEGTYYLWNDGVRMRGLIVDNKDTPSVDYAKHVYKIKQCFL